MILFGNQQNRSSFNPDTVIIGTQVWTLANFAESTLIDGIVIPEVSDNSAWAALTTAAWCNYNNDPANGTTYGKLYNWYCCAAIDAAYTPYGWRTPTVAEWDTLIAYLGGTGVAGGALKMTGTTYWNSPNTGATNSSGFTMYGGGRRVNTGGFFNFKALGFFLSSNSLTATTMTSYYCYTNNDDVVKVLGVAKQTGFSIRLIKI